VAEFVVTTSLICSSFSAVQYGQLKGTIDIQELSIEVFCLKDLAYKKIRATQLATHILVCLLPRFFNMPDDS
jgi:hypothetical protein